MAEFPRELVKTFVRLRAAVAEKNFAGANQIRRSASRDLPLRFVIIEIRNVNELCAIAR